ncbi:transglutaminase-like domain protein [Bacteriovorax sp. BAL6_X]|uniref:transglutaminase-like domain-containing protein n=1 Tax=Bacteriovorax sp. BAL6_X TaxID=1201290 RepID=UPI0003865670|nr:transglutaminase-like domain-containing protein [Bacteriovorax sp. BAL6_X]EPZ49241.1 transglutaminase-like domain protein [Bacteriovorax sp. BAL6_X]
MQKIIFLSLLFTFTTHADFSFNANVSTTKTKERKYKTKPLIQTDEFNTNSYWADTKRRTNVVKSIVGCLSENCAYFNDMAMSDIFKESVAQFGKEEGEIYFTNVVAGLIIGSPEIIREKIYSSSKFLLSFNQKMYLAHILGSIMSDHYDFERDKDGVITTEEIFDAIKNNTQAGVCRDIAVTQANILKKLNVEDVYVVAYNTRNVGHATVIVQDPGNKDRIINFNYGETRINESQSAQGLAQDTTLADFGINYRIFNADGEPVDRVPSEVGYLLNQAVGLDLDLVAPGVEFDNIDVISMNYENGEIRAKSYYAESASGLKASGVAASLRKQGDNISLNTGIAIQREQKKLEHREFIKDSTSFYFGMDIELRTGKVDLGILRNVYADVKSHLSVTVGTGKIKVDKYQTEGDFSDNQNMYSSSLYADSSYLGVDWKGIVTAHASIMKADVREEGKVTLAVIGGTIKNELKKQIINEYGVGIQNTIYIRQEGATADYSVTLFSEDGRHSFEIGLKAPLYGKTGFWVKGNQKSTYLSAQTKILKDSLKLGIMYIKKENQESTYRLEGEYTF